VYFLNTVFSFGSSLSSILDPSPSGTMATGHFFLWRVYGKKIRLLSTGPVDLYADLLCRLYRDYCCCC
jgi:hypothetical protein